RVVGAVDERHRKIDHREPKRPVLERVDYAFFHRRDVVARHHTAGDAILELEAGPTWQRLDLEHHVAELTVTAGLLLMAAALCDRLANGLAISHRRRTRRDRHHEPLGKAFRRHAQMHLALPPDDHLVV